MTGTPIPTTSNGAGRGFDRRLAGVLFLAAWASFACFHQSSGNPNLRTHMFLTLALVEEGTPRIDRFAALTLDQASWNGHVYSDKAPGLALTAVPALAAGRLWQRATTDSTAMIDAQGQLTPAFDRLTWWTTSATCGLFAALAVAAVYVGALLFGATPRGAVFAAAGLAWATPLWGWATALCGHAVAAALLVTGFVLFAIARGECRPRRVLGWLFAAGACLTWAVVVEFTAGIAALAIGVWGVAGLPADGPARRRDAALVLLGAIVLFSAPLFVYNAVAFDAPFRLGYGQARLFPGMQTGFYGVGLPDPAVLLALLFSRYRGLVWISPLAVAGLGALPWLWRGRRDTAVILTAVPLAYLLPVAGYAYWDGGWSTGPRHLTPMLPFVMIALGLVWSSAQPAIRAAGVALAALSGVLTLVCVSTSMFAPSTIPDLFRGFLLPNFAARLGGGPPVTEGIFASALPWLLGLHGATGLVVASVIPLGAIAFALTRTDARPRGSAAGVGSPPDQST